MDFDIQHYLLYILRVKLDFFHTRHNDCEVSLSITEGLVNIENITTTWNLSVTFLAVCLFHVFHCMVRLH